MEPNSLHSDLYGYLVDHMYATAEATRMRSGWVMNGERLNEIRLLALSLGHHGVYDTCLPGREYVFGIPILAVRDNGGVPHLEPID